MTPIQARAARAILKVGVRDVAAKTGVTPNTVSRTEAEAAQSGRGPNAATIAVLKAWYETQGIQFLDEGDVANGVGVVLVQSNG